MACLHRRMVQLHTHSLTYHVFARVVSRCLNCSFRLPELTSPMAGPPQLHRLSSDLTVFSQQPASDVDSVCPACETLSGYLYFRRSTLIVCDLTQPLPFLWPAGIPFVCIIHPETYNIIIQPLSNFAMLPIKINCNVKVTDITVCLPEHRAVGTWSERH